MFQQDLRSLSHRHTYNHNLHRRSFQGPEPAMHFGNWIRSLEWPAEPVRADDVGISFLEVYANFTATTGQTLPIADKSAREGAQTFLPLSCKQVQMLPQARRNASVLSQQLEVNVQTLGTLAGCQFLQKYAKPHCGSIVRMGATWQTPSGVTPRPKIKQPVQTMRLIWSLFQNAGDEHVLNRVIPDPGCAPVLHVSREHVPERLSAPGFTKRLAAFGQFNCVISIVHVLCGTNVPDWMLACYGQVVSLVSQR